MVKQPPNYREVESCNRCRYAHDGNGNVGCVYVTCYRYKSEDYTDDFDSVYNNMVCDDWSPIEDNIKKENSMQIKSKVELKKKGEVASLPTVKKLLVALVWKTKVDLDLMAFYTKKDGTEGSVYSSLLGGSLGDLNAFPFIKLSGDEGVGALGGDSEENLRIEKLDDISKLVIVALNYTDAEKSNPNASFSNYDGKVSIVNESGESFEIPLESTEKGTAAIIATIDNSSPIGATVKREDIVVDIQGLVAIVPGARVLAR